MVNILILLFIIRCRCGFQFMDDTTHEIHKDWAYTFQWFHKCQNNQELYSDWDEVPSEPPYPREIHLVTVFSQHAPKKLKHIYVYIPIIYTFPLFNAKLSLSIWLKFIFKLLFITQCYVQIARKLILYSNGI